LISLALFGAALGAPAPPPAIAADTPVVQWNDVLLEAIRQSKPGPPIVARALAIVHTAMYDAWAAYDPVAVGTQLGGALRRPAAERTPAHKEQAISFAAYRALIDLFPAQAALFTSMMSSLGLDPANTSTDISTAAGVGNVAAAAVINFRHSDGANQLGDLHPGAYSDYTGYVPVNDADHINDPNRWQPLRFSDGHGGFVVPGFLAPHWGKVTSFAITDSSELRPASPSFYPHGLYHKQALEILHINARLTDRQKVIAEYWADGPHSELPPGHWNLFAQFVSNRDGHSLDDDVKLFFALDNAELDASIAVWECKRFYDYVRPITAIHFLFAGHPIRAWAGPYQGTKLIKGEDWLPFQPATFITPPFAEYVSGHSAFSAAGAEILKLFTGSDAFGMEVTIPAGSSKIEPGATPAIPITLSWSTFSEAADEAGWSRRFGGIHFEAGDLHGRALGRQIGAMVWEKAHWYFKGGTDCLGIPCRTERDEVDRGSRSPE
jgi:hypothetical protein